MTRKDIAATLLLALLGAVPGAVVAGHAAYVGASRNSEAPAAKIGYAGRPMHGPPRSVAAARALLFAAPVSGPADHI